MTGANFEAIKFNSLGDKDFGITVRKRVNEYFKSNNISKLGDHRIWTKVVVMPLIYFLSFGLIMTNWFSHNLLIFYGLWMIMAVSLAGAGFAIMHDACHGALSKKRSVNNFFGALVLNLAGGSTINWKIQHNVLHHTYTNIDGYDDDIDPGGIMRFSPHQPLKWIYRFQIVYAWFFYALLTFSWATYKDFLQLDRYKKKGLLKGQGSTFGKEMVKLIILKIAYYSVFIALPILVLDVAWGHVVLAWLSMHFVSGFILGIVFQPAHVIPETEYPLPNKDKSVEVDWAKHQMLTTANFSPNNRLFSWYVGGLNFQIEHHLFPNISHVHHRSISKIVKSTAEEFGIPYNLQSTFIGALANHAKMLYKLGK
ncbi:MAG: acyl-CoA desaturase [Cyclobacteriaceae bacterium]|nr:acyl-CoA desaturase [Cyclobacteriaceae bacterium]